MERCLKEVALKSKIETIDGFWCLLMAEKGIRNGIWHAIYWHAKTKNKYMKDNDLKKHHHI